jgi:hypothetical protein
MKCPTCQGKGYTFRETGPDTGIYQEPCPTCGQWPQPRPKFQPMGHSQYDSVNDIVLEDSSQGTH